MSRLRLTYHQDGRLVGVVADFDSLRRPDDCTGESHGWRKPWMVRHILRSAPAGAKSLGRMLDPDEAGRLIRSIERQIRRQ